jgi:TPR repeat protein
MERAAKRGDAFAQLNLAANLATGDEGERDFKRAVFWYRKAAAQKEPEAIYNLGLMQMFGEGLRADVGRGLRMLERAARLGSAAAQQFLGDALVRGACGTKRDPKRAAYYYLRSLADGHPRAALLLAAALEGRGKITRTQLIDALNLVAAEGGVKAVQPTPPTRAAKRRKT